MKLCLRGSPRLGETKAKRKENLKTLRINNYLKQYNSKIQNFKE